MDLTPSEQQIIKQTMMLQEPILITPREKMIYDICIHLNPTTNKNLIDSDNPANYMMEQQHKIQVEYGISIDDYANIVIAITNHIATIIKK